MQKYILIQVFLTLSTTVFTQIETRYFESPQDLEVLVGNFNSNISPYTLPTMNKDSLVAEDEQDAGQGPFKFAESLPVNLNSDSHGVWSEGENTRSWTMKITSKEAYSQTIIFRQPILVEGATIYVFDGERKMLFGPINRKNWWGAKEKLISDVIPGETAYVVYCEPLSDMPPTRIEIMEICYGYKNVFEQADSGSPDFSPQDLHCTVGDNWRAEARSVVRLFKSGKFFCSGSLVNNTAQDFLPYVLTANHCDCSGNNAEDISFQFFFWENSCNVNSPNSGAITFANGSVSHASNSNTDFLLLEMNDDPSNHGVVYSGWDLSPFPATSSTGIHHPNGAPTRVAQDNNAATTHNQIIATLKCLTSIPANSSWKVIFDIGGTENGSSGSPLYNQSHLIVGQLYGFSKSTPGSYYGRLDHSWTGAGSSSTSLGGWLNPGGGSANALFATTRISGTADAEKP